MHICAQNLIRSGVSSTILSAAFSPDVWLLGRLRGTQVSLVISVSASSCCNIISKFKFCSGRYHMQWIGLPVDSLGSDAGPRDMVSSITTASKSCYIIASLSTGDNCCHDDQLCESVGIKLWVGGSAHGVATVSTSPGQNWDYAVRFQSCYEAAKTLYCIAEYG